MFNSSLNKKSKDILEGSTLVRPQDEFNSLSTVELVDLLDHTKVFEYVNYDFNISFLWTRPNEERNFKTLCINSSSLKAFLNIFFKFLRFDSITSMRLSQPHW